MSASSPLSALASCGGLATRPVPLKLLSMGILLCVVVYLYYMYAEFRRMDAKYSTLCGQLAEGLHATQLKLDTVQQQVAAAAAGHANANADATRAHDTTALLKILTADLGMHDDDEDEEHDDDDQLMQILRGGVVSQLTVLDEDDEVAEDADKTEDAEEEDDAEEEEEEDNAEDCDDAQDGDDAKEGDVEGDDEKEGDVEGDAEEEGDDAGDDVEGDADDGTEGYARNEDGAGDMDIAGDAAGKKSDDCVSASAISGMRVEDLRQSLRSLGAGTRGTKLELQDRLLALLSPANHLSSSSSPTL